MKHLAKIQREFVRYARLFENMTEEQQSQYLAKHPQSTKQIVREGHDIADKLNLKFLGYQPEAKSFWFVDMQTESSFMAKNLEHAELKLQQLRQKFDEADVETQKMYATASTKLAKCIADRLLK